MKFVFLPSFQTENEASAWAHRQGRVIDLKIWRGPDGLVRGSVWLRDAGLAS